MPAPSFGLYTTEGLSEAQIELGVCIDVAQALNPNLAGQVQEVLDFLGEGVETIAKAAAVFADVAMTTAYFEAQLTARPPAGDLASAIESETGPNGDVYVALITPLEDVAPHNSGFDWWKTQEFGTGQHFAYLNTEGEVPSQLGRGPFFGTFFPTFSEPQAGRGDDFSFIPGGGPVDGRLIINREIRGRHFLQIGFEIGAKEYQAQMEQLQNQVIREIEKLITAAGDPLKVTGFLGILNF